MNISSIKVSQVFPYSTVLKIFDTSDYTNDNLIKLLNDEFELFTINNIKIEIEIYVTSSLDIEDPYKYKYYDAISYYDLFYKLSNVPS